MILALTSASTSEPSLRRYFFFPTKPRLFSRLRWMFISIVFPSVAAVLSFADEPASLLQAALNVHIDALPVGSADIVERHTFKLFLCVAECLLERGVGLHNTSGFGINEENVLCSLLDHCMVEQLTL